MELQENEASQVKRVSVVQVVIKVLKESLVMLAHQEGLVLWEKKGHLVPQAPLD